MNGNPLILVALNSPLSQKLLIECLPDVTFTFASSWSDFLSQLQNTPAIVILSSDFGTSSLNERLKNIQNISPETFIITTSPLVSWHEAILALNEGAYDYLPHPFVETDLKQTLTRALSRQKKRLAGSAWELVGTCEPLQEVFSMIKRVAPTESTILIQGESGTGKELVARAIHNNSDRHLSNFISVNCGAFTPTLLESELFGHMKGSFTGADRNKKGLVEVAEGGTFFLDEISEMPLDLQVKLLRLLEEKEFIPVGANKTVRVNVRFVCATNRKLESEVKAGTFREDLFYRLNVIPLHLPPLKDRGDDVLTLSDFFIRHYSQEMNSAIRSFSEEVKRVFSTYSWPGNVRELENTIQRALALANPSQTEIGIDDIEDRIRKYLPKNQGSSTDDSESFAISEEGFDLVTHLEEVEKTYILKALEMAQGNKATAARLLGLKLRSINYKLDKYDITFS